MENEVPRFWQTFQSVGFFRECFGLYKISAAARVFQNVFYNSQR